jgi:hypothetical protein
VPGENTLAFKLARIAGCSNLAYAVILFTVAYGGHRATMDMVLKARYIPHSAIFIYLFYFIIIFIIYLFFILFLFI